MTEYLDNLRKESLEKLVELLKELEAIKKEIDEIKLLIK
jgi:hypothetical protein